MAIGLQACILPNAIERYDAKSCAEIRKIAQENFLGRTPLTGLNSNDDAAANEILGAIFQEDERIERQAKKTSYARRCN